MTDGQEWRHPVFGDGLDAWGSDRPAGWSDAVRRAQLAAHMIPDGMWGPDCGRAGIPMPAKSVAVHKLAVRLRFFNLLLHNGRLDVPYHSSKCPDVGDAVAVRTYGHEECAKCGDPILMATVVSIDDAGVATLEWPGD